MLFWLFRFASQNPDDWDPADSEFASGSAPFTLLIEGKNGVLASAEGWNDGDKWTMKSTEQNRVYFSAANAIVKEFWATKKSFLPTVIKK